MTRDELSAELQAWMRAKDIPPDSGDAYEMQAILRDRLSAEDLAYLRDFCERWDAATDAERADGT